MKTVRDFILDHKEGWALKNWCFWTVVLEMTLESPLDCKGIPPVHPKGNESWMFIGKANVEAEIPILWLPDMKSWHIWKDPILQRIESRRRGWQKKRWVDGITESMDVSLSSSGIWWWTWRPGVLQCMGSERVGYDWVTDLKWLACYTEKFSLNVEK